MIYSTNSNAKEKEFLLLLENSKELITKFYSGKKTPSSDDFEKVVLEQMQEAAIGTKFEKTIEGTKKFAFPDIIAKKYFGVEVKMTSKNQWTSTGNSVLESTRIDDVEKIYIMFGKFGGQIEICYRLYQKCLPAIKVTHSPRYSIDMKLPEGKSIFDRMGIDYDKLRNEQNVIKSIKDYYRGQLKKGQELWWIDQDDDDKYVDPIIKPFRELRKEEQENFIIEAMILFPEMFGHNQTKFERAAAYLISEYNAVSANLRDLFTAGGKMDIEVNGKIFKVSRIVYNMFSRADLIKEKIKIFDEEKLKFYWRCDKLEKDRLGYWKKLLNKKLLLVKEIPLDKKIQASDIYDAGLL